MRIHADSIAAYLKLMGHSTTSSQEVANRLTGLSPTRGTDSPGGWTVADISRRDLDQFVADVSGGRVGVLTAPERATAASIEVLAMALKAPTTEAELTINSTIPLSFREVPISSIPSGDLRQLATRINNGRTTLIVDDIAMALTSSYVTSDERLLAQDHLLPLVGGRESKPFRLQGETFTGPGGTKLHLTVTGTATQTILQAGGGPGHVTSDERTKLTIKTAPGDLVVIENHPTRDGYTIDPDVNPDGPDPTKPWIVLREPRHGWAATPFTGLETRVAGRDGIVEVDSKLQPGGARSDHSASTVTVLRNDQVVDRVFIKR